MFLVEQNPLGQSVLEQIWIEEKRLRPSDKFSSCYFLLSLDNRDFLLKNIFESSILRKVCFASTGDVNTGCGRQGCQMVCFQTKNPNFGKIWRALEWKLLLYFMTIWNILRPFGIILAFWYSFW
jgi:hypothetical protein